MNKDQCICEFCNSSISRKRDLKKHQNTEKCKRVKNKKDLENKQITTTDIKEIKGDATNTINGNENKMVVNNTINKNKTTNILKFSPDFSKEHMRELIKLITPAVIMEEYGLTKIYEENVARNDKGEYGIYNTNKSNPIFNFIDKDGNLKRKEGIFITKNFSECIEDAVNVGLKTVKHIVVDLTDYKVIHDNVKNLEKDIKHLGKLLYVESLDLNIDNYNKEKIKEELDHPDLIKLKNELEKVKNRILEEDEIGFGDLSMKNVDTKRTYKDNEKRLMIIEINGIELEDKKFSTPKEEEENYKNRVIEQKQVIFKIDKDRKILFLEKKIRDFKPKWYMKKRLEKELNEQIKNQKNNKKSRIERDGKDRRDALEEICEDNIKFFD